MSSYTSSNLVIPYAMPANIPPALQPIIKPLYIALQNIVQTLILYCGIAPRNPGAVLSSNNDPTAILANNTHRFYCEATEAIAQGAMVNLYANVGVLFLRNANATDGTKQADAICSQSGGIASGAVGEVILNDGVSSSFVGLTPGGRYYLSTTNGDITLTPPVASGNLQQSVGQAINANTLRFWTGQQIQH